MNLTSDEPYIYALTTIFPRMHISASLLHKMAKCARREEQVFYIDTHLTKSPQSSTSHLSTRKT